MMARCERDDAFIKSLEDVVGTSHKVRVQDGQVRSRFHKPRLKQRFDLGPEDEAFVIMGVVEGLDAEAISRAEELVAISIQDRDREHAVEAHQTIRAPLFVGVEYDLGV